MSDLLVNFENRRGPSVERGPQGHQGELTASAAASINARLLLAALAALEIVSPRSLSHFPTNLASGCEDDSSLASQLRHVSAAWCNACRRLVVIGSSSSIRLLQFASSAIATHGLVRTIERTVARGFSASTANELRPDLNPLATLGIGRRSTHRIEAPPSLQRIGGILGTVRCVSLPRMQTGLLTDSHKRKRPKTLSRVAVLVYREVGMA